MGGTLGHIALIFGLGAILGKLLSDGGGATRIAYINLKFGQKHVQWACSLLHLSSVSLYSLKWD